MTFNPIKTSIILSLIVHSMILLYPQINIKNNANERSTINVSIRTKQLTNKPINSESPIPKIEPFKIEGEQFTEQNNNLFETKTEEQKIITKAPLKQDNSAFSKSVKIITDEKEIKKEIYKKISKAMIYPKEAIQKNLEGTVIVFIIFNSEGKILTKRIEEGSGYQILDQAALNVIEQLPKFNNISDSSVYLPIRFTLN